ncbi:hypothetical protein GW7_13182 [Heterocephalus glaber]|uniref:Uncharacterized protein n=1 Tax=Heterocephalus glaber TaxID=10181 RepID=G5C7J4_HETGA|nr:hypothetical protein GW7_13182 [Heterocephalus glaber]
MVPYGPENPGPAPRGAAPRGVRRVLSLGLRALFLSSLPGDCKAEPDEGGEVPGGPQAPPCARTFAVEFGAERTRATCDLRPRSTAQTRERMQLPSRAQEPSHSKAPSGLGVGVGWGASLELPDTVRKLLEREERGKLRPEPGPESGERRTGLKLPPRLSAAPAFGAFCGERGDTRLEAALETPRAFPGARIDN